MNILLRIGEITLSQIIASGSIGEVWRGTHRIYRYPIALKQLTPMAQNTAWRREEFEYEIQLLMRLSHPGIVSIYDTQTIDKSPILAMELADNSCSDTGFITTWAALRDLLLQVLEALRYLHGQRIIHCDIKPANILRFSRPASPPTYKLIDFGIAQSPSTHRPTACASKREYRGSPEYSAPEQILGDADSFGPWTDLYALGSSTYELATGHPPFGRTDFIPLTQRHLNAPPPPFNPRFAVPPCFSDWLQRLMRKNPADRFSNAQQATQALLSIPAYPAPKWHISTERPSKAK